ncbi:acyl-coenzyme A amino acid N-acyltransferase 1-like isoform X2 [Antedon mediterranea]|uniref:acyl-coenzyme A amino acid N-acyltransferase 1-like isoform X2 n=1 Tax=Antedon mediterranea TaxID=105859 RepID=UPI003AF8F4B3
MVHKDGYHYVASIIQHRKSIHIQVSPSPCLADQCPTICVKTAKPDSEYTIKGCIKQSNNTLMSYGHFRSSSTGEIDPSQQPSNGGTYTGVDGAGLLWSLQFPVKEMTVLRVKGLDVLKPLHMDFTVHEGTLTAEELENSCAVAECQLERTFLSKDLECQEVSEGRLRGLIFKPPGKGPFPGVIDMYGTAGGLKSTRAALLASCGFVTYSLPFFAYQDLVKLLMEVELEYFQEALLWFSSQEYVDSSRVGMLGTSTGAIISMVISTMMPDMVRAIACVNAVHHHVLSPFLYKGEHLPFVSYDVNQFKIENNEIRVLNGISDQLNNATEETVIPIEKSKADFLFIAGEDDQILTTRDSAFKLAERLSKHGHHKHEVVLYPGTGHLIDPGLLPVSNKTRHPMSGEMLLVSGGQLNDHAKAQQHSWQKIKEFFKNTLA